MLNFVTASLPMVIIIILIKCAKISYIQLSMLIYFFILQFNKSKKKCNSSFMIYHNAIDNHEINVFQCQYLREINEVIQNINYITYQNIGVHCYPPVAR